MHVSMHVCICVWSLEYLFQFLSTLFTDAASLGEPRAPPYMSVLIAGADLGCLAFMLVINKSFIILKISPVLFVISSMKN